MKESGPPCFFQGAQCLPKHLLNLTLFARASNASFLGAAVPAGEHTRDSSVYFFCPLFSHLASGVWIAGAAGRAQEIRCIPAGLGRRLGSCLQMRTRLPKQPPCFFSCPRPFSRRLRKPLNSKARRGSKRQGKWMGVRKMASLEPVGLFEVDQSTASSAVYLGEGRAAELSSENLLKVSRPCQNASVLWLSVEGWGF